MHHLHLNSSLIHRNNKSASRLCPAPAVLLLYIDCEDRQIDCIEDEKVCDKVGVCVFGSISVIAQINIFCFPGNFGAQLSTSEIPGD